MKTLERRAKMSWLQPAHQFIKLGILAIPITIGAGCSQAVPSVTSQNKAVKRQPTLTFRSQQLAFQYDRGDTGSAWPVETTGGGVGLLDFDGDGRLDLFFAQGGPLLPALGKNHPADTLLRNLGEGRFEDVSQQVGLVPKAYGQGVTVADYDGDGDPDVYVTRYGRNTLWRNDQGRFTDVTEQAGVGCPLWSLGAAFLDYDRDGDLDLFVANYFAFDPARAPFARDPKTGAAQYGMPREFEGLPDVLYRNNGDGTFSDVTTQAGVAGKGRGMGCLATDFDGDGWIDILVANDAEANALWHNRHDGTFEDVAAAWGIAVNGEGQVEANMGIAQGDHDGDGLQDVLITHFFGEHATLWHKDRIGDGLILFEDRTQEAGLALDTLPTTGWGVALADFDQDGFLDLVTSNGHIRPEPGQTYNYENPPLVWRNSGQHGRFINVSATAGDYFLATYLGRGLVTGDLDGDGDLDVVIVHHHVPSVILWNETMGQGNVLRLDLIGPARNRDAIGAWLLARIGQQTIIRSIDGGGSYISASDRRIHIGLGQASKVDHIEVHWPNGQIEYADGVSAGGVLRWQYADSSAVPSAHRAAPADRAGKIP
jgi:hypothetical protein